MTRNRINIFRVLTVSGSGVQVSISRSEKTLLKLNIALLIGLLIFIAGRPKAALLFWFFGDFRCGALFFMVIHVIYKYKNR